MRFATSFHLFLTLSLSLLVVGNIAGLVHYAPRYFADYMEDVKQTHPNDEYALINAFISSKDLDAATIEEYRLTLEDLRKLSQSLESYAPKKELSTSTFESLQKIGFSSETIREVLFLNSVQSFLSNIPSIALSSEETPEKRFLLRLLSTMVYMNLAYILAIIGVSFLWTRWTFSPIRALTDRIHGLLERRAYMPLEYTRHDEFAPLLDALNIVSSSLAKQEKIRTDFIADFSHEIKTPIAALKILFEGVEDGVVPLDAKNLSIAQKEIERLLSTTDAILEYERVVHNEGRAIVRERFDLLVILQDIAKEYAPKLLSNTQHIHIERKNPFFVHLEKEGVMRIAHNAFSNFIKYAGPSTVLSVRMHRRNGRVHLIFLDNGRGVTPEQLPYLREKFYQADTARSGDVKRGIGIGLAIIDTIALYHDGALSISSEEGKWFELHIALSEEPSHIIHASDLRDSSNSV